MEGRRLAARRAHRGHPDQRQAARQDRVPASASKEEVEQLALTEQNIVRHLEGLTVRKVVVIPGKLVNVVAN